MREAPLEVLSILIGFAIMIDITWPTRLAAQVIITQRLINGQLVNLTRVEQAMEFL